MTAPVIAHRTVPRAAVRVIWALAAAEALIALVNLSPLIDRYAVGALFDVNRENTLVVWLASGLLLAIAAGACLAASVASGQPDRIGWLVVAAAFVALSADETASLHELAGEIGSRYLEVSWLPSLYLWVVVVAPFAAIGAVWMLFWLRRTLGRGTTPARLATLALCAWLLVPAFEALDPTLGGPRLLVVVEESLEAAGEVMMLAAIALHLAAQGFRVTVSAEPA